MRASEFIRFIECYKDVELGQIYVTYVENKKYVKNLFEIPTRRNDLGELDFFFSMALPAHSGPWPLIQFRNHFSQTTGLLGRVISPLLRSLPKYRTLFCFMLYYKRVI
jgi:hypothetical protein